MVALNQNKFRFHNSKLHQYKLKFSFNGFSFTFRRDKAVLRKRLGTLLLQNAGKKLAHTHRFKNEISGLKSKHLTTRPRTPELCDLPTETRELSRGKKHPHFPITLAYHKCKQKAKATFLGNATELYEITCYLA